MMRESDVLELKEQVTNTFLKTVSAFANYNTGSIIFGVNDSGKPIGLDDVKNELISIENKINDSISPVPKFSLEVEEIESYKCIRLTVYKGMDTPYFYKAHAYKRADTATVPVDKHELNRLVLESMNIDYENLPSDYNSLTFSYLEKRLVEAGVISVMTDDILRTLDLLDSQGNYNIAAELLSDQNPKQVNGIDILRFGKDTDTILLRKRFEHMSILEQFDKTLELFEEYYQYEEVENFKRIKKELIPKEAIRESLANALIHRDLSINSYIQISMFENRITIKSPGGLPADLSTEEFLENQVSIIRNPIVSYVFFRLNIIEQFGTGIKRIVSSYSNSLKKPEFDVLPNNIIITLPVISNEEIDLSSDEIKVLTLLNKRKEMSRSEIESETSFNKSKTIRIINSLIDNNLIKKIGDGPSTAYTKK